MPKVIICPLGDAAAWAIEGRTRHFRPGMERWIAEKNDGLMEAAE